MLISKVSRKIAQASLRSCNDELADALIKLFRSWLLFRSISFELLIPGPDLQDRAGFPLSVVCSVRMQRLLGPDESIRVSTTGHVKSDDLPTVVDPVDCGRADTLWVIDRRKLSVVKDETVGET